MRAGVLAILVLALTGGTTQPPVRDRAPADQRPAGAASISGRITVLDAQPVTPVRRAKITLTSPALPAEEVTDTDTDGRYRFDGLPAGDYRVTAEKPGFVTLEFGMRRPFERPDALTLAAQAKAAADIALPRGAAVEGRLTNDAGEPLQNVIVSAQRFVVTPAGRRPSTIRDARTDDLGRYRIHSLPPGGYYVSAAADPIQAITEMAAPGAKPAGFARTYFPGVAQPHAARRVSLGIGQEAPGTDFTVLAVPIAAVTVTVLDSSGKPAGIRGARMQAVGAPPGDVRGTASGNTVRFPRVPPGEYWLTITTNRDGPDQEFAAQRVSVTGEDIADLQITTTKGASIDLQTEHDGVPVPGRLRLESIEPDFELPTGPAGPPSIAIPADGRLRLDGVFGPRLFRISGLPPGWALKGVWLDDVEVTDAAFDFRASQAPRRVRIALTNQTATLEAIVTGADDRPASGVRVVVFAADEPRWGPTSRFVAAGLTDAMGRARVPGLLTADYLVTAVDYLEDDAWHDPDELRRLRAGATRVSVEQGPRTYAISLKVTR